MFSVVHCVLWCCWPLLTPHVFCDGVALFVCVIVFLFVICQYVVSELRSVCIGVVCVSYCFVSVRVVCLY